MDGHDCVGLIVLAAEHLVRLRGVHLCLEIVEATGQIGSDIFAGIGPLDEHAEIIGALDRVLGLICLVGTFFGAVALVFTELIPYRWGAGFAGLLSFLLGLYLMGLGRRVARLEEGARESQVMLSVLLLFFPPFLTAFGIYALIVMTSDRARGAAIVGIFHDDEVREAVADRVFDLAKERAAA